VVRVQIPPSPLQTNADYFVNTRHVVARAASKAAARIFVIELMRGFLDPFCFDFFDGLRVRVI